MLPLRGRRASSSPGQVVGNTLRLIPIAPSHSILRWAPDPLRHRTDLPALSSPLLVFQPSQEDSPWRQGQVVDQMPWTHRDRPGPPRYNLQPGTSRHRQGEGLPALSEVLPPRDRKSHPSTERRRPHATQR